MEAKKTGLYDDLIVHPGESLKDYIDEMGLSQKELALRLGVSQKHISQIISGKARISSDLALRLSAVSGIEAQFWANLQVNYDIRCAEYDEIFTVTEEELAKVMKQRKIIRYMEEKEYWK